MVYTERLRDKLNAAFPSAEFSFDTGGMLTAALSGGLPAPINVQVEGNDLKQANAIARSVVDPFPDREHLEYPVGHWHYFYDRGGGFQRHFARGICQSRL